MVDIDHFKQVNDKVGHFVGDDVIRLAADVLRKQVREEDIVCRFGGEEFVIFLKSASLQEGWDTAERIRRSIEAATTPTDDGDVKITVSVGGSMKSSLEHIDDAIKRADECLYRAKEAGRNRTIVDWGTAAQAPAKIAV